VLESYNQYAKLLPLGLKQSGRNYTEKRIRNGYCMKLDVYSVNHPEDGTAIPKNCNGCN